MPTDTQTIQTDIHGKPALPGLPARHWGQDQPDTVFSGTIEECVIMIAGHVTDRFLVFVYDEPPTTMDDLIYVSLDVIDRFEIIVSTGK